MGGSSGLGSKKWGLLWWGEGFGVFFLIHFWRGDIGGQVVIWVRGVRDRNLRGSHNYTIQMSPTSVGVRGRNLRGSHNNSAWMVMAVPGVRGRNLRGSHNILGAGGCKPSGVRGRNLRGSHNHI